MAVFAGPEIQNDGLVLGLDLNNPKFFSEIDIGSDQHGFSEWVCMNGDTDTYYSAIYPNTTIYSIDENDLETELLTTGANPERGVISISKGLRYRGSKPIHIGVVDGGGQHDIVPSSLAGFVFGYLSFRNTPSTLYVWPVKNGATIEVFENCALPETGIYGTPTQIIKAPKKQVTEITISPTGLQFIRSSSLIVATVTQSGADRMILTPASAEGYRTRNANEYGVDGGGTSVQSNQYISDFLHTVIATEIADGSGGDSSMFLGKQYLTGTYSFGSAIADFEIAAPYPNTTIDVSYWENGDWVLGETFNLNGTETSPAYVARDGNAGFGVPATNLTGNAAGLGNNATLWKFEGNNPFHLAYNDSFDDEEILLGWNSADVDNFTPRKQYYYHNLANKRSINAEFQTNAEIVIGENNILSFNGTDQEIKLDSFPSNDMTVEAWIKPQNTGTYEGIYGDGGYYRLYQQSGYLKFWGREENLGSSDEAVYLYPESGRWYHAVGVLESGVGIKLYVDGILRGSKTLEVTFYDGTTSNIIGNLYRGETQFFSGELAVLKHYTRVFSPEEIRQNFEATRGRFGI